MKIGTNTTMAYEDYELPDYGSYALYSPISASFFMLPYYSPYNSDGSLASIGASDPSKKWRGTGVNPLEWIENNPSTTKKYKLLSSLFIEIQPIEGLTLRSMGGVDYGSGQVTGISYPEYYANDGIGSYGRNSSTGFNLSLSNTATYVFDINREHNFNILLGQEMSDYQTDGFGVSTTGQYSNKLNTISTGTVASGWSDSYSGYSMISLFARAEYNYQNRYYLEGSVRRDASSRFGVNARWGTFWSLDGMWDIRRESFMINYPWITNLQLSASVGTSGNSSIPNYAHLALVAGGPQYNGEAGAAINSRGNEDLTWEKLLTTNVALRMGFFNRYDLSVEFYNKKTTDMLMAVPVSHTTGAAYEWDNIGAMINRGVELDLGVNIIRNKDWFWRVTANASYNMNKLTELYRDFDQFLDGESGILYKVGEPVSGLYLVRYAGVNPVNGEQMWYTKDGELTNEYNDDDKVLLGKSYHAPWQGGFATTLSWKGLTLSAQFSWVGDRYVVNNDRFMTESNGTYQSYNQSKKLLYNRWKQPGDITDIPRHGELMYFDSRLVENASFLRLKNLSISYDLPQSVVRKARVLEAVRVYAQAQNLLTFTKFSGMDPEGSTNMYRAAYPMSRQFTFGIDVTF